MSRQFIYALSSLGQVSISKYNHLFKTLYLPEYNSVTDESEINHKWQVTRILDSLGYFEINFNKGKVFMCPPALIMMPSHGLPRALLTGARTPFLLKRLKESVRGKKEVARLKRYCQSAKTLSLPDTVIINAADSKPLKDIADELDILLSSGIPGGWQIAKISASVDDIEKRLDFIPRNDINWKSRIFDTERLVFRYSEQGGKHEYALVEYTDPSTQQKRHWIWNGKRAAEANRDWGRYLVLKKSRRNIIIYDETKEYLGVPITVPLPKIIARAAALCSGKAPFINRIRCKGLKINESLLFYIYPGVPDSVANMITNKTGQSIIYKKIDIK